MRKSTTMHNLQNSALDLKAPLHFVTILGIGIVTILPFTKPAYAAGVVGTGTPASCTEAALNTALNGGGTVTFNCGASAYTIAIAKEKAISANTVIDGGNLITLNGGGKTRIFSTGSIQFTVKNLTIANGFTADQGGGILSGYRSTLTVSNCKFNNNVSTKGGTFDGGGAIYISSESTATIDKSTFTGNTAGNGGAINNLLSDLTVTNSTFTGNKSVISGPSGGGGGAIYIDGGKGSSGKIAINGSTFTNNTAVFQGGTIFVQLYDSNTMILDKSTISGSSVTGSGNQGLGGGIFVVGNGTSPTLTVTNTTISGNSASNQGGGIWNGNNITVNITNSTIANNKAISADGKGGLGGGIMRTSGKMTIVNSTIAGNTAGFQGGGIIGDSNVTLKNTIIANNKANNGGNNWNIKNNCFDSMTNGGNNLQFPAKNQNDPSDKDCVSGITTADPKLGALANNGGTTQTMALLTGSGAINIGNNATCSTTDQRGIARPQGSSCDAGAFEAK